MAILYQGRQCMKFSEFSLQMKPSPVDGVPYFLVDLAAHLGWGFLVSVGGVWFGVSAPSTCKPLKTCGTIDIVERVVTRKLINLPS